MSGTRVALVAVLGVGAATCFFRLGAHSLWFDEITGARLAEQRTVAGIFASHHMDSHPPAMALAERWSRKAFDLSEWSLRMPAALASVLALLFIYGWGVAWGDGRVGGFAAALAVFSPVFVFFAHDARPYALAMFFTAAASACFLLAFHNRRKYLWFPLYALFVFLALYTHYFTTLVVAAHVLIVALGWLPAFRPREAASPRRYLLLGLLFVVALGVAVAAAWPVFETALLDRERFPGGEMRVTASLVGGAVAGAGWDRAAANVLFGVAAVAGVAAIWRRRGAFDGAAALALAAVPALLPVVVIRLTTQYWNPRFSYFAFPAVMVAAAFGFVAVGRALAGGARRNVAAAALAVVLAAGVVRALADDVVALRVRYTTPIQDFRGAVALTNRNRNWQTKVLVWPYRNWNCYHFYTKTQGGPDATGKPRFAVMKLLETWPRLFIVSTDGEFSREVLDRHPSTVRFRLRSVDILYRNPAYEAPGELYRRLPGEVRGVPPEAWMNALGRSALRAGRKNAARMYFTRAAATAGDDKTEVFVLAQLYAESGEYERALRLAGGYARRHPHESWPYTRIAEIYFKKGDRNSAIAYYRRALWLDPSKEDWQKRLRRLADGQRFFRALFGYSDPRWM